MDGTLRKVWLLCKFLLLLRSYFCVHITLMCVPYLAMLFHVPKNEKFEQDRARYGVRVITVSFLLSKRGFTFLFFMFLGFLAWRRALLNQCNSTEHCFTKTLLSLMFLCFTV